MKIIKEERIRHIINYHDSLLEEFTKESQWLTYSTNHKQEAEEFVNFLKNKNEGFQYKQQKQIKYQYGDEAGFGWVNVGDPEVIIDC